MLPALLIVALIGPVEELGWRGVALPLLQQGFAPLWASLILGAAWGLWHLPAFRLSGTPQSAWCFGPYVLGVLALGVIVTPMFNAARGSLLIPMVFHLQSYGPAWPEVQPWENHLFAIVAVIIVVINRRTMLHRGTGVTDVLLPVEKRDPSPASVTAGDRSSRPAAVSRWWPGPAGHRRSAKRQWNPPVDRVVDQPNKVEQPSPSRHRTQNPSLKNAISDTCEANVPQPGPRTPSQSAGRPSPRRDQGPFPSPTKGPAKRGTRPDKNEISSADRSQRQWTIRRSSSDWTNRSQPAKPCDGRQATRNGRGRSCERCMLSAGRSESPTRRSPGYLSPDRIEDIYRASITRVFDEINPRPDWLFQFAKGDAGPVLVRQSRDASLLVVGTPEHVGLGRLIAGSVAHYCVSHAACPVVVVPAALRQVDTPTQPHQLVLCVVSDFTVCFWENGVCRLLPLRYFAPVIRKD